MQKFILNDEPVEVDVPDDSPLVWVIRDELNLKGTKFGCGMGLCGACTVHIGGQATRSCITPVSAVEGADITTIEGLAEADGTLHPVQQAFIDHDATQCGFCTPGVVMSAKAVINAADHPDEEAINDGMAGVLCRCTGHIKVKEAIRSVAAARK